jgi:FkbM family methyltransferase
VENLFRNLPDFKGKRKLAKILFNQKLNSPSKVLIKGKFSCSYYLPNLTENIELDIFVNGVYEEKTINYLDKLIPSNCSYLDLGANIGAVLIPLCKKRPDIRAIAVEAAPWIYQYLQKNILLNKLTNIRYLNNALFDEDDIPMDFFSPKDKYGKGSLSPVFSKDSIQVISKKVDTIIQQYDFSEVNAIKADVEGYEYYVFKGAQALLGKENAPDIIFEFVDWAEQLDKGLSPGAAQRILIELGYQLYIMKKNKLIKLNTILETGAADLFATKKQV